MDNFNDARKKMVQNQLIRRGIKDQRVLDSMLKVPRHRFIDEKHFDEAYKDSPLPIICSQTISQPYMVALMTELIEPNPEVVVLEIGTGSGYQTAILADICKKVYSIERHKKLTEKAKRVLKELGYTNIELKTDDGTIGWPEKAPFDAIIVTAAAPRVPEILVNQLNYRGRMVIPIGPQFQQTLELILKRGDSYISKSICGCVFVPLIGKEGWK